MPAHKASFLAIEVNYVNCEFCLHYLGGKASTTLPKAPQKLHLGMVFDNIG
ncbi:MAG: hypothetical protein KAH06_08505 [Desulfobacterales bacterium]|nr:hypothetical protein [Desulfobacterales bacterium]